MESDLEATVAGQQLLILVESMAPDSELTGMLDNIFAAKKTATLVKRVGAMFLFLVWARGMAIFRPLLCHETVIYAYVLNLHKKGAAATSASSFRQALTFYRHLLNCPSADDALASPRIKGCCTKQLQKKRPLQQAREMSADDLRILENLTMEAPTDQDRVASGFFTFCTISSSRFGDASNSTEGSVEEDVDGSIAIELGTLEHKTAGTGRQFLPLIAFSPGLIRDKPGGWAKAWLEARRRCKLVFGQGPIMPALGSDGQFLNRKLSSGEAQAWLQELLKMGGSKTQPDNNTLHRMKATVLSWAAKYGMSPEDRRTLGHHAHPTFKTLKRL